MLVLWSFLVFVRGKTGWQDLFEKCTGFCFQDFKYSLKKCTGHFREVQFYFPFPSLLLDHFDVQDLKILLSIISFQITVASSQHYALSYI